MKYEEFIQLEIQLKSSPVFVGSVAELEFIYKRVPLYRAILNKLRKLEALPQAELSEREAQWKLAAISYENAID